MQTGQHDAADGPGAREAGQPAEHAGGTPPAQHGDKSGFAIAVVLLHGVIAIVRAWLAQQKPLLVTARLAAAAGGRRRHGRGNRP